MKIKQIQLTKQEVENIFNYLVATFEMWEANKNRGHKLIFDAVVLKSDTNTVSIDSDIAITIDAELKLFTFEECDNQTDQYYIESRSSIFDMKMYANGEEIEYECEGVDIYTLIQKNYEI